MLVSYLNVCLTKGMWKLNLEEIVMVKCIDIRRIQKQDKTSVIC